MRLFKIHLSVIRKIKRTFNLVYICEVKMKKVNAQSLKIFLINSFNSDLD